MEHFDTAGSRSDNASAKHAVLTSFVKLGEHLNSDHATDAKLARMVDAIEGEILPRLMLTFLDEGESPGRSITDEDRSAFLDLVLNASADDMHGFMRGLVARGVPEEAVLADLLAHSARELGALWDEDLRDFSEVTLGLCRLHEVLRHASVRGDISFKRTASDAPSILLANGPDDQHVFGVLMVAEFFRRDGWNVWSEPATDKAHLCAILAREPVDVMGLSIGCSMPARDLAALVASLRKASKRPDLRVFLGGYAINQDRSLVEQSGADGWAEDAVSAPETCRALLADQDDDC